MQHQHNHVKDNYKNHHKSTYNDRIEKGSHNSEMSKHKSLKIEPSGED